MSTVPCGSGFGHYVLSAITKFGTESDHDVKHPNNDKHRKLMKLGLDTGSQ